jgi:hypothetical protein
MAVMRVRPELDPDVQDVAPTGPHITVYDEAHFVTYMRLLDAEADGADWEEVAHIVLHRNPAKTGYRRILEQDAEESWRKDLH